MTGTVPSGQVPARTEGAASPQGYKPWDGEREWWPWHEAPYQSIGVGSRKDSVGGRGRKGEAPRTKSKTSRSNFPGVGGVLTRDWRAPAFPSDDPAPCLPSPPKILLGPALERRCYGAVGSAHGGCNLVSGVQL